MIKEYLLWSQFGPSLLLLSSSSSIKKTCARYYFQLFGCTIDSTYWVYEINVSHAQFFVNIIRSMQMRNWILQLFFCPKNTHQTENAAAAPLREVVSANNQKSFWCKSLFPIIFWAETLKAGLVLLKPNFYGVEKLLRYCSRKWRHPTHANWKCKTALWF